MNLRASFMCWLLDHSKALICFLLWPFMNSFIPLGGTKCSMADSVNSGDRQWHKLPNLLTHHSPPHGPPKPYFTCGNILEQSGQTGIRYYTEKTDQEIAAKIKESIHNQVCSLYSTFQSNSTFILSCHHYLFTSRSLEQCLKLDIDSITCWTRSVDDAQQALFHHYTQLRLQSNQFLHHSIL